MNRDLAGSVNHYYLYCFGSTNWSVERKSCLCLSGPTLTELWSRAVALAKDHPDPLTGLYISALNDMIDLHTERVIIRFYVRVPQSVLLGVYLVAALTLILIGVQGSYSGKRNYLALIIMVLILSVVFLLIVDLNRPDHGLIQVPQKALLDLQQQIRSQP